MTHSESVPGRGSRRGCGRRGRRGGRGPDSEPEYGRSPGPVSDEQARACSVGACLAPTARTRAVSLRTAISVTSSSQGANSLAET
jgi:hypothetical protein